MNWAEQWMGQMILACKNPSPGFLKAAAGYMGNLETKPKGHARAGRSRWEGHRIRKAKRLERVF